MSTTWTEETISIDSTWSPEVKRYASVYGVGRYGISIYGDASSGFGVWNEETISTDAVWTNELKS